MIIDQQTDSLDYSTQSQDEEFGEVYEEGDYEEEEAEVEQEELEDEAPEEDEDDPARMVGEEAERQEERAKRPRSAEETKNLAAEFLGLEPKDIVVSKKGEVKIIQKINGIKRLITPQDYQKGFGLNQAGYEKLNEGKNMIKGFKGYLNQVKQNPDMFWELADKLGLDSEEMAERYLSRRVEEYDMSPEEKHTRDLERRVAEAERREKLRLQQEENARIQQEVAQHRDKIGHELVKAMMDEGFKKADTGKNSRIMYNALTKLQAANRAGHELSCRDAVYSAKREWQDDVVGTFNDIDPNQVISILPEEIIKAIRNADISNLRSATPSRQRGEAEPLELEEYEEEPRRKRKKKQQTISDYFDNL